MIVGNSLLKRNAIKHLSLVVLDPLHHRPPSTASRSNLLLAGAINGFCNKRYDEDGRANTPLRAGIKAAFVRLLAEERVEAI